MQTQRQGRGDAVAQGTLTKYLRIVRVKHLEAATGDELATMIRDWFIATTETTGVIDYTTIAETTELSEDRELMDWRYQVSGGIHHIMIFYAE